LVACNHSMKRKNDPALYDHPWCSVGTGSKM
jgi:ElaB/YqjD/DUF883 family membrane-anchored ribosome-binding protein